MDDLTNDDLIALLCENGAEVMGTNVGTNVSTVLLRNPSWEEPWMQLQSGNLPAPDYVLTRVGKNYLRNLIQARKPSSSVE